MLKRICLSCALVAFAALSTASFGFEPKISATYDGKPAEFNVVQTQNDEGADVWTFTTQDGKLAVDVALVPDKDFPDFYRATSRVYSLLKHGEGETGLLENLNVFAQSFPTPSADAVVTLNALRGSPCAPIDFEALEFALEPGESQRFSTPSGRSSNEISPYLEANFGESDGLFFAIGWTGCWRADFVNNGGSLDVNIGLLRCGFKLKAYESFMQPTVLFAERKNMTRRAFKTLVHRYMIARNVPRDQDGNVRPPIVALTAGGGNKTPEMMLDVLNYGLDSKLDFDVYWVDAGWYGAPHEDEHLSNCGPNWSRFVGDWRVNTTTHPTGDLLPIADAVHKAGKKFLLWFEPERISGEAPISKVDPFDKHYGLGYYGDPRSADYIEKTIFGVIEKHHIDVYRQDFNMDPAGIWAKIEEDMGPNRVGIAEMKHVAGMYKFLDDMRARFPWIMQENCASGGRRIDLEMVKRAHSYCRSDYYIGPKPGDSCFTLGQNMTFNLTPYLPFQGGETNCVPNFDDYGFMSVASSGTVFTPTDLDGGIVSRKFSDEETAWFKKMLGWASRLKDYYMGDFYQLTDDATVADDVWCAWCCYRPDEEAGFAIAFRRAASKVDETTFELPPIDPDAKYAVETFDGEKTEVEGDELAKLEVKLDKPRSFKLILFKKIK